MAGAAALAQPPDAVRLAVREALTQGGAAQALGEEERRDIARALVRIAHAAQLLDAVSTPAKTPLAGGMAAADSYSGRAVDDVADTARRTIQAISFPRFVAELIQGVFRAMLETNQVQLQQYLDLVRAVSQSLDGYASLGGGGDDAAKRWLAERFPASYAIEEPDPRDRRPGEEPEPIELVTAGSPPTPDALRAALGLEADAEVPTSTEQLVGFVKRSLARNRQGMLATMVQMGMQRIVIDAGRINAAMRFHIDATSAAAEQAHSGFDTRTSASASASGGWGPFSASASVSSTIGYVRTTDTQTEERTRVSAELDSSVELQFRTDQVPLDRIASANTVERLRLNTLNPARELEIAGETERARVAADQAVETARASRQRTELAPTLAPPAPPAATTPTTPPQRPPAATTPPPTGSTGTGGTGTGGSGTGGSATGGSGTGTSGTGTSGTGTSGTTTAGTGGSGTTGSGGSGTSGTTGSGGAALRTAPPPAR
ncbi:hypothetical protein ACLBKU_17065 [Erythrobacter sp. NE805]|uniref:hypothetical protein n=1 Tax=Erythrobacter sp. NE805 TaxID=3389875 RepID=UPI00396B0897